MKSTKGKFLIASPKLTDPNFAQAIVLMVQHDEKGALGVVINRPLEVTVQQACEQVLGTGCEVGGVLHHGGPCEALLMVIHTDEDNGEAEVIPGVYFTTAKESLELLLDNPADDMRFFVGYSGWGPGQLEAEFETGSWTTTPATAERIFGPVENLWTRLNTEVNLSKWVHPTRIPEDPSVN
ncbi:MAG TPA: YqgE/AlgH family protein [Tepidisphaeraceae bacterium]|nr:YqgE/AlgH family protein [Tepidisphaeraceae bacterium]